MNPIHFDPSHALLPDTPEIDQRLRDAVLRITGMTGDVAPGFLALPDDQEGLYTAQSLADRFREKGELLVLGIGGSALGVRAIDEALDRKPTSSLLVSDNVDPVGLYERLASLDPAHTVVNALATVSGIICDGAKPSCAAKVAASVEAGILGFLMYERGQQFYGGDGIVTKGVENTIDNIGRLGRKGMKETDKEIIRIMLGR